MLKKIVKISGALLVLLALVIAGLFQYHTYNTQRVRTFLAQEVMRYADRMANTQSNVVFQCTDGCWLGRVRFLDGDWAAVAHHRRHFQPTPGWVGDITVVLTSDGQLHHAEIHYCREEMFKDYMKGKFWVDPEGPYTDQSHFLSQFYIPLQPLNEDFEPMQSRSF